MFAFVNVLFAVDLPDSPVVQALPLCADVLWGETCGEISLKGHLERLACKQIPHKKAPVTSHCAPLRFPQNKLLVIR